MSQVAPPITVGDVYYCLNLPRPAEAPERLSVDELYDALRQVLRGEPLPPDRAAALVFEVARLRRLEATVVTRAK
jgi:hypothetical protein